MKQFISKHKGKIIYSCFVNISLIISATWYLPDNGMGKDLFWFIPSMFIVWLAPIVWAYKKEKEAQV